MQHLDPTDQRDWYEIVQKSIYKLSTIAKEHNIPSLPRYLKDNPVVPKEANRRKVVAVMEALLKVPRPERHPSYGYATPDEIKQIDRMGLCPARSDLLKQIEERTKNHGKVR